MDEKKAKKVVISILSQYPTLKVYEMNMNEREEFGCVNLFPRLICTDKETRLIIKQIERTVNGNLDEQERAIIERKYLQHNDEEDLVIYSELGLKKGKFYEKKKSALMKIAVSLGVIEGEGDGSSQK